MLKAWSRTCTALLAAFCAALPVRASIPRHSPDSAAVALLATPDPAERVGEWLIRDPLGEAGGINLTSFCGNDPINRIDPLGLFDEGPALISEQDRTGGMPTSCLTGRSANDYRGQFFNRDLGVFLKQKREQAIDGFVYDSVRKDIDGGATRFLLIRGLNGFGLVPLTEAAVGSDLSGADLSLGNRWLHGGLGLGEIALWVFPFARAGGGTVVSVDGIAAAVRRMGGELSSKDLAFLEELAARYKARPIYACEQKSSGKRVIDETISGRGDFTSELTLSADEALDAGLQFLGPRYRELGKSGSGVFLSENGLFRFRIDNGSLLGNHAPHIPHVHFEVMPTPNAAKPLVNNHVPFLD